MQIYTEIVFTLKCSERNQPDALLGLGAGLGFGSLVFKISNSAEFFFDSSNIYILVGHN